MESVGPWCHFFTPHSFVCYKALVHGAAIAENGSGVTFFSTMGLFGTYFQLCPVITDVSETGTSQGQGLVYSFALSILGVLTIHLDCWPVSGAGCRTDLRNLISLAFVLLFVAI